MSNIDVIKRKIDEIINFDKASFGFYKKKCLKEKNTSYSDGNTKGIPYVYYTNNIKVLGKIIPVDKNKTDDNSMIEIMYLELFNKEQVETGDIPSIPVLFNYYTHVDNSNTCISKIFYKKFSKSCNFLENYSNVMFCEYCSHGDIDKWSYHNTIDEAIWKSVIAQVIATLVVLQEKYLFIHNDLHPGNVLIERLEEDKDITFKNLGVSVKNEGVLVKLWDFEFSNIYNENYSDYSNPIKFDIGFNKSYDIHTFLKGLLQISHLPLGLINFIEDLYPLELLYQYPLCDKIVNTCSDNRFISNGFLTKYAVIKYKSVLVTPEKLLKYEYLRDIVFYV